MANTQDLRTTLKGVSTKKAYYITAAGNDFGIDSSAAFEGLFYFAKISQKSANEVYQNFGPVYAVDINHDGSSGRIDVFEDESTLEAPESSERIVLVGCWFSNADAAGLTLYDGTTALPTLDLAANQGLFLPLELA